MTSKLQGCSRHLFVILEGPIVCDLDEDFVVGFSWLLWPWTGKPRTDCRVFCGGSQNQAPFTGVSPKACVVVCCLKILMSVGGCASQQRQAPRQAFVQSLGPFP